MQRSKMFMSVDSDKSAGVSTTGAGSNAGSDVAGQFDSSTKVCVKFDRMSGERKSQNNENL